MSLAKSRASRRDARPARVGRGLKLNHYLIAGKANRGRPARKGRARIETFDFLAFRLQKQDARPARVGRGLKQTRRSPGGRARGKTPGPQGSGED